VKRLSYIEDARYLKFKDTMKKVNKDCQPDSITARHYSIPHRIIAKKFLHNNRISVRRNWN